MGEHLRRIRSEETHDHYCGKIIQNELIDQLGKKVKSVILERARAAKYFPIILDCTPDVSHTDQMSFTIRFVDISGENICVQEHFLAYRPASDSTGEGLTSLLLDELKAKCGLDMNNCRGQGYDNGANIVGKNKGVQKRQLFTLFSGSVKSWAILKLNIQTFTIKAVTETRWECRVQSLKAVRYQYFGIYDALVRLAEEANNPKISSEANSLAMHLADFQFIVTIIVWYDILFQVNLASKTMQAEEMNLATAVNIFQGCQEYLTDYRLTGYESAVITAKEIAESLGVDAIFKDAPSRRKKRMFDYKKSDDAPTDSEQLFKTTLFYSLNSTITPVEVLQYIHENKMHECFCNIWISLRILLPIPITVASGERSLSKLKLIKTYLRSTMGQDRLTALVILAIENEVANSLDMTDLIEDFANAKMAPILRTRKLTDTSVSKSGKIPQLPSRTKVKRKN
ncbi:zinc finger MYM-type protein 1-like [Athalia rosae]|uniref:zinc finger MYM-type protein 1-like n=1 Tax=Athalia rosae TaxID=37344 RepID=UPI0020337C70|nr:zinc finger MYM-type protein 1-like [Athalia rosae]